jgi:hypothetical protein
MKDRFPVTKLLPMLAEDVAEQVREIVPDIDDAEYRRKSVCEKAEADKDERSVIRYISTREVDRDMEVLVPEGAVISEYLKNPVVLFGHNYSEPPHAKAEWVKADKYGLKSKAVYADTERGQEIWKLIEGGFLNAASVGFITLEAVANGGPGWADTVGKLSAKWEVPTKTFDKVRGIITKWLLLEYSDVPVPSNGSALIQRSKELGISDNMLKSLGLEPIAPEPEAPIIEVRQVVERWCRPVKPVDVRPVRLPLDVRAVTEQAVKELVGVR